MLPVDTNIPNQEYFGDPLDKQPTSDITRVYVQNLNSLHWDKEGG